MTGDEATDRVAIAELVEVFFAAFKTGMDAEALRELFLPQATIVRTCGDEPVVYGVESFIRPRAELLDSGRLTGFREWEESGRLDVYGDIAQYFCSYAKSGVQDGEPFTGRGMKSLQFVRTGAGWRISALAWDDERA
ncbi:nuclear transport factor 2 family protein [Winogradskya humida]|uniref:SnoaL-like domain-containing protein n=1 Tax=Winogradskya humida TaxID=113566 RepID=A0ABQ4A241_9ACTN|nr:nuclear transport factor 2 family protein [Actinoplanes humidus]GIE24925.1 hypothetical protein Ahu01nite_080270 [Actinoplanes humidus]